MYVRTCACACGTAMNTRFTCMEAVHVRTCACACGTAMNTRFTCMEAVHVHVHVHELVVLL